MTHWTVPVVEIRTADGRVGTGISGVHCAPELLSDVIGRYYSGALLGTSAEDILGHTTDSNTRRHYLHARSLEASRRLQACILHRRHRGTKDET